MRSRIKICGLSRPCDIDYVNASMPDYIGFVFAKSRRQVSPQQAAALKKRLNRKICAVGVFVNEEPERIAALVRDGVIDWVQLHGQEDEAYLDRLRQLLWRAGEDAQDNAGEDTEDNAQDNAGKDARDNAEKDTEDNTQADARAGVRIIKAFSVRESSDIQRACRSSADYILLDQGAGGTGQSFDWRMIGGIDRPFFLAGGLGPDNIGAALQLSPFALDVSSGVETNGFKDARKIELCVRRTRI